MSFSLECLDFALETCNRRIKEYKEFIRERESDITKYKEYINEETSKSLQLRDAINILARKSSNVSS